MKKREKENRGAQSRPSARQDYDRRYDLAALEKLRDMGVKPIAVARTKLPAGYWRHAVALGEAEAARKGL